MKILVTTVLKILVTTVTKILVTNVVTKLMGPEEIHIFIWEGALRPPKRKCDRPKNLEVFLVNFQISAS